MVHNSQMTHNERDAGLGDLLVFGGVKFFTQALIAPFHVAKILQQVNYIPSDDFLFRLQHHLDLLPSQGDAEGEEDMGGAAESADSSNGDALSSTEDTASDLADSVYAQATSPTLYSEPGPTLTADEQGYLVRTTFAFTDPVRPQYQLPPQEGSLFSTLGQVWRHPDEGTLSLWKGHFTSWLREMLDLLIQPTLEGSLNDLIGLPDESIPLVHLDRPLPNLLTLLASRLVTGILLSPLELVRTRSEYDRGVNTFSPEGRLFQVEYAIEAIKNHTFTYDERIKVESLTQAVCDLALRFGESADGQESIMSRPFGVALLIAGVDEKGPQLFHADPSGTFMQFDAKAIGSGSEGAQTELQEHYNKSMTLRDAEKLALKTLKQVMEEKLNAMNVQLASVTPVGGRSLGVFKIYTEKELEPIIAEL
ncbi:proteasome component pup2 [Gonapodya sp. JEL0774]|nr:proteasome component pup2 [Gonapodya sp. JEL0774]